MLLEIDRDAITRTYTRSHAHTLTVASEGCPSVEIVTACQRIASVAAEASAAPDEPLYSTHL